jgi:putative transposase
VRFAFIRDHKAEFPVEVLCEVLKVARSGYYAWSRRPPSPAALRRDRLVAAIRRAHGESRATYGSPRVYRALEVQGVPCCENTVAKLMKAEGVRPKARRPFVVRTTDSRHDRPVAANTLDREFYPDRPNAVWTADITYVPTAEGWLYLAVVLDLFSRRVVGWATADHLRSELTCDALRMASEHRRPRGELLHHSDRGVQYASESYGRVLAEHGIEPSMSRTGNCWDNAVTESFFSTAKRELTHHESYATREEARRSLFEYIEVFYNRQRLHSTLGYRSPAEYEVRFAS